FEDNPKKKGIDQQQRQRIHKRPQQPQKRSFIAPFHLAPGELYDQLSLPPQVVYHRQRVQVLYYTIRAGCEHYCHLMAYLANIRQRGEQERGLPPLESPTKL